MVQDNSNVKELRFSLNEVLKYNSNKFGCRATAFFSGSQVSEVRFVVQDFQPKRIKIFMFLPLQQSQWNVMLQVFSQLKAEI